MKLYGLDFSGGKLAIATLYNILMNVSYFAISVSSLDKLDISLDIIEHLIDLTFMRVHLRILEIGSLLPLGIYMIIGT